ncbi:MAG: FRG domain-containing protein [Chthoniobacterales bacterium]
MTQIDLLSPEDVISQLNELPNSYIFRGQASAHWNLESSLERLLGDNWSSVRARQFEDFALQRFRSKFHLYDGENIEPTSRLAWLSLMQHYGAPTRLIDFTESPFVALYFAMESISPTELQTNKGSSMAIFALDYSKMMDASIDFIKNNDAKFLESRESLQLKQDTVFDDIVDPHSYKIAWATEPQRINKRLDRQSGCFLVSGDRASKIEEILTSRIYNEINLTKFIIPFTLYDNLFALLRKMNLNSKSLYGDLQGLCKSIRMELQVYAS